MAAVDILRYPLGQVGAKVPDKVLVSVGFGPRNARKTLGFCFPTAMGSGIPHLFISPTLREPVAVLSTLTHELLHAADDCKSKHSGNFRIWARAIGLEGKLTATYAGDALRESLLEIASELGEYPHAKLSLADAKIKKDGTRMLKATCPNLACPLMDESGKTYTVRTTRKWVEMGLPSCPCGTVMELAE